MFVQPLENYWLVIVVLTGSEVGEMAVRTVLEIVLRAIQGFFSFVRFVLSACAQCVIAGQNLYLGPTIHLTRPGFCFESHHS